VLYQFNSFPSSRTLGNHWSYNVTITFFLPFPECHIIEIKQYVPFCYWIISFSVMDLMLIPGFLWLHISCFYCQSIIFHCMIVPQFIHIYFLKDTCGFHILKIINKTAINMHTPFFVWICLQVIWVNTLGMFTRLYMMVRCDKWLSCVSKWLYHFWFSSVMNMVPCSPS
jgi:hypothetical protein